MEESITKSRILQYAQAEFNALHGVVGQIDRDAMVLPGVEGDWSVKDILCHLTAWRRLYVLWTQDLLDGREPDRPAPDEPWDALDDVNASLYRAHRDTALQEALDEFVQAHTDSLAFIESLAESDLIDPDPFAWRKGDPLWHMVAGNTWLHDREHRETILGWLAEQRG